MPLQDFRKSLTANSKATNKGAKITQNDALSGVNPVSAISSNAATAYNNGEILSTIHNAFFLLASRLSASVCSRPNTIGQYSVIVGLGLRTGPNNRGRGPREFPEPLSVDFLVALYTRNIKEGWICSRIGKKVSVVVLG